MKVKLSAIFIALTIIFCCISAGCISTEDVDKEGTITVIDAYGREVTIPENPTDVATAGSISCRFITYVQAQDSITSVDFGETRESRLTYEPRPFALANRQFITMPAVTSDSGAVNIEQLLVLNPQLLIMSAYSASDIGEADDITEKTGIPVVLLDDTADLGANRDKFDYNINLLAKIFGKEKRAEEFLSYIDNTIADLNERTKDIPESEKPTVYIGGVAYNGAHGITFTEPYYPPFQYVNIKSVAADEERTSTLAIEVSEEKLLEWTPEVLFIDATTLRYKLDDNAFQSLESDPNYVGMQAVENDNVYVTIPYVWNGINHESSLANAYYVGKVLFPEKFEDIDPVEKTNEIYNVFVGEKVFDQVNGFIQNIGFTKYTVKA